MQKLLVTVVTSLALVAFPAYADHGHERGHYERHGDRASAWAGVAAIGAIAGLAILAEQSRPVYAAPAYVQPVYQPPANYAPPQLASDIWYYCQSSAMYYPYTKACPDGWQAVPAGSY